MICVLYVSSATALFSEAELSDILALSRRNNAAVGITGTLLYAGGNIMQALEGPRAQVDALMARIRRDPRHNQVSVLLRAPIQETRFPGWWMEASDFTRLDDEGRTAYRRLLAQREPAVRGEPGSLPASGVALRLLESFRRSMQL